LIALTRMMTRSQRFVLTKLVPPCYSSEHETYLKAIEEEAADIKQLREQLGKFGNTKGFAISTIGTKLY
jgi:hypothetical protein